MQRFSYDAGDPVFDLDGWRVSAQVITFENAYGLDPAKTAVEATAAGWRICAAGLTWAGGQETSAGSIALDIERRPDGLQIVVEARHPRTIRCTKLVLSGLPRGAVLARGWAEEEVPASGVIYEYPGGPKLAGQPINVLASPLAFVRPSDGGPWIAARSRDECVRAKRIAVYPVGDALTVELIHEEAAPAMGTGGVTPPWRIERTRVPDAVVRDHIAHVARAFGLLPWEERADVPPWAREIALVAALHGMHWSGYVFNTYDQMLDALRWIAAQIEGGRVLAYLPGWEGRYYWQYGDYRPDARLGGSDGFARLATGAHALGVHLMPMFGAHSANTAAPNFEHWGEPARLRTAGGYVEQGNKPDWDGSRAHDPAWQAILNPGAPTWRRHLCDQISAMVEAYDLAGDAIFLDTTHWWQNDPQHPVYEGLVALRDELKARFPNLLVAGEGWYDALGAVTPVSHSMVPARWAEEAFAPFNRTFAHLSTGDPSRGSTGVHELGYQQFQLAPLARHRWPTVTIVDGTVARAPDGVAAVIRQAREYADRFLAPSARAER